MTHAGDPRTLLERHRAVLPSWMALYYDEPIELVRGVGRHVWDRAGTRYLDLFGGILTTSTAHALPAVVEAVQAQAARMLHTSTLYLIEQQIELAERIAACSGIPDAKVFFTPSGTEANEAALLIAACARGSNHVLALRNSYHGRSFAAVALTGNRSWRPSPFTPLRVDFVHGAYRYRSPWPDATDAQFVQYCVDDLRSVVETTTAGPVAALIAEPIQGVGGFATPPDGMFAAFTHELADTGALLICDEVQTGWGRTGDGFWGYAAHGVTPDIITFAKGLGNGLSVGGVIARAELMDAVPAGSISTFGGNPLSMAGSLANLEYLLDNDLQANARTQGTLLRRALDELVDSGNAPAIGEVRGKGLMVGVELVRPGTRDPDPAAATAALEAAKRRRVLVGKGGLHANVLRIAPPMTITSDEMSLGADVLCDVLMEAGG